MKNSVLPFGQMTEADFLRQMHQLHLRAQHICGRTADGRPLSEVVSAAIKASIDAAKDPVARKKTAELLQQANQGDHTAAQQLNGFRIVTATNYLLASQNMLPMFCETVTLGAGEVPLFKNVTRNNVTITYVAQDGSARRTKVVQDQTEEKVDVRILTTPRLRLKKTNPYGMNILDAGMQTLMLAYDIANQMEGIIKTLLTSSAVLGTFTFTGNRARYPYVANSRVKTANLPTTNDIVLTDNGTGSNQSNAFRVDVLKKAGNYVDKWAGAFVEGNLALTGRVLVPGSDAVHLTDDFSPTGDTSNPVADKALVDGWRTMAIDGRSWTIIPDNTLNPGAAYFEMTRKPLHAFLLPALDKDRTRDDYEMDLQNEIERYMQKAFSAYSNPVERVAALRVIFSDTYSTSDP